MRWAGNVERMRINDKYMQFWQKNPEGKRLLRRQVKSEDNDKRILKKLDGLPRLGTFGGTQGHMADFLTSIKCGKILDQLRKLA